MRRPAPLLYLSLVARDWARFSALACPPFGDLRRLWRCRNPVVLNESASVRTSLRKGKGERRAAKTFGFWIEGPRGLNTLFLQGLLCGREHGVGLWRAD